MEEGRIEIGGIAIRVTGSQGVRQTMLMPGMKTFMSPSAEPAITFDLDVPIVAPTCQTLHEFDIADGHCRCRFAVDSEDVYYVIFGDEGILRYDLRQPQKVVLTLFPSMTVFRFALWSAYALSALPLGAVPVHSSTVVCNGRAVLCLGESGTGKSTHTRLWQEHIEGCHLLNDDSPILRVADDGVWVYGSPWSGKTSCYLAEHHPVAALLRLEQRPYNEIRRLGTVESFAALQPSCPPMLAHDERMTDAVVAFLSRVIGQTPVYRMGCLPNAEAALMSHKTIMG